MMNMNLLNVVWSMKLWPAMTALRQLYPFVLVEEEEAVAVKKLDEHLQEI
jgi:hypothetical protein